MANGSFGGGTGTLEDPFLVEDAKDLLAATVRGKFYKQVADIDLSSYQEGKGFPGVYVPYTGSSSSANPYGYNGNGYKILNLFQHDSQSNHTGLFRVQYCAGLGSTHVTTLENLCILNANITARNAAAIVTLMANGNYGSTGSRGYTQIKVENCFVSGTLTSLLGESPGIEGTGLMGTYDTGTTNYISYAYVRYDIVNTVAVLDVNIAVSSAAKDKTYNVGLMCPDKTSAIGGYQMTCNNSCLHASVTVNDPGNNIVNVAGICPTTSGYAGQNVYTNIEFNNLTNNERVNFFYFLNDPAFESNYITNHTKGKLGRHDFDNRHYLTEEQMKDLQYYKQLGWPIYE